MKKTNAMRLLDRAHIAYRAVEYEVDPDDLSGTAVAAKIGLEPTRVFKTLLVRGAKTLYFALVPVHGNLSLKALGSVVGERKPAMVPVKEIQALTGYIRGGVTVLGAKKPYPVYVHESMIEHDEVSISAGQRGMQILLEPQAYVGLIQGTLCQIAMPES